METVGVSCSVIDVHLTSAAKSINYYDGLRYLCNIDVMSPDKSHIWNNIELYQLFVDNSCSELSRRILFIALENHFDDELLVFSSQ